MTGVLDALGPLVAARLRGTPLVVMLDVDGTLAPIVAHPSLARVPDATRRVVSRLAALDGVRVVLVSGRAAADARRLVAAGRAWVIGNHGAEVIAPDGEISVDPRVAAHAEALARVAGSLQAAVAPLAGVVVENKRWSIAVHWRVADPGVVPLLRAHVERTAAMHGLLVHEGKAIFEVRPPVPVDKGVAVLRLAGELDGLSRSASLLYAGDDVTDEDAFRALRQHAPRAVTVHIGDGRLGDAAAGQPRLETAAELVLATTDDLRSFLESLLSDRT